MTDILKIKFVRPQEVLKLCIFFPTLSPVYFLQEAEIKESIFMKVFPSGYPNILKCRPYLLSISNEKYNYFLRYLGGFLSKNGLVVKVPFFRKVVNVV